MSSVDGGHPLEVVGEDPESGPGLRALQAPQAVAADSESTADWLCGALEVDELAVRPGARGRGVAGELLAAVTADAPGGRSWLLTSTRSPRAVSFYRHRAWTQVTHPSHGGRGIVVFLGPRHPARRLAAVPSPPP